MGLLVVASGCGGASRNPPDTTVRPNAERIAALETIYRERAEQALEDTHPADVYFVTHMIPHHAQALVMAGFAPESGAGPSIQTLAARIINAQKDEIAVMTRWLTERGLPLPGDMQMMMPGMLTQEELAELEAARGGDFDRLFLQYMIRHHQGAVTMVRNLFATDGAAQNDFIFKLASDIHVDQATEIARMETMLESLNRTPSGSRSTALEPQGRTCQ